MSAPYYADELVTVWHGDCLDVMATMPDNSVDAVVTDPPYDLTIGKRLGSGPASVNLDSPAGRARITTGFMGKAWDGTGIAFRPAVWQEALRVLKPGGHLLAFGGTRTWHRLACAVEDAGFEVRDSIAWLYGSGFPKSLDVSKAIDKAAGATREVLGYESRHMNRPATEAWQKSAAPMKHDPRPGATPEGGQLSAITAPATPAAQQWAGWGTALKPAFEPIVVARKPLAAPGVNVLCAVESSLRAQGVTGEIRWTRRPASGAARPGQLPSSCATRQQPTAATSASPAGDSGMPSVERPTASSSATTMQPGATPTASTSAPTPAAKPLNSETKSSPPTAAPAPAAASGPESSSPSTTSTEVEPPTARRRGGRSTPRSGARDSLPVTESFAGTATGLTGSRATVRIDRLADGTFAWPDGLPEYIPGGPITVAANVLAHGTGALNVDGCRIGDGGQLKWERPRGMGYHGGDDAGRVAATENAAGRWPTNVVLDDTAAAELDEQSGEIRSSGHRNRSESAEMTPAGEFMGAMRGRAIPGVNTYNDSGGASRFFPTFRYEPKAPTAERPRDGDTAHPTVKPLDLMRWLVRLVTPPGGLVLDPFAGSGTTGEACIVEGARAVLIEREADHLPLIVARLSKPIQPDLFGLDA